MHYILIIFSLFLLPQQSYGISKKFVMRGFQHCTGRCDDHAICEMERNTDYLWCKKNCSHKMDIKKMCASIFPDNLHPILPFDHGHGLLNTNTITPLALQGLDRSFIEQTKHPERLIGTCKLLLLVHAQFVKGQNIQKLDFNGRDKLGLKLLNEFFKKDKDVLAAIKANQKIPDQKVELLFTKIKSDIIAKLKTQP